MKTLKVSVHKGEWMGLPGISTTYHLDKRRLGLRVNELALQGKPVSVRRIEGDGRTDKFQVHCAGEL